MPQKQVAVFLSNGFSAETEVNDTNNKQSLDLTEKNTAVFKILTVCQNSCKFYIKTKRLLSSFKRSTNVSSKIETNNALKRCPKCVCRIFASNSVFKHQGVFQRVCNFTSDCPQHGSSEKGAKKVNLLLNR